MTVQPGRAQLWDTASARAVGSGVAQPVSNQTAQDLSTLVWTRMARLPCALFDPGGRMLAVSVGASTVHWIDPETGRALRPTLAADEDISLLRFSGNGRRLIVARFGGEKASVWDVSDETSPGRPRSLSPRGAAGQASASRHSDVEEIALNSDGRVALTAHSDEVRLWDVDSGVPLSPPLPFAGPLSRAWFDDNNHVAMLTRHAYMAFEVRWIWTRDLNFGGLSPDELRRAAWLLSGRRVDDVWGPVRVEPALLTSAWNDLRGHSSALLNEPREPLAVWHRRLAKESEMAGLTFAARVHLDGLIAAVPEDPEPGRLPYMVYGRRAEILGELGEWDRAAADFAWVLERVQFEPSAREGLAIVKAYRGDQVGYRSACAPTLEYFRVAQRQAVGSLAEMRSMEMLTLMPDALGDPGMIVRVAEKAMTAAPPGGPGPSSRTRQGVLPGGAIRGGGERPARIPRQVCPDDAAPPGSQAERRRAATALDRDRRSQQRLRMTTRVRRPTGSFWPWRSSS